MIFSSVTFFFPENGIFTFSIFCDFVFLGACGCHDKTGYLFFIRCSHVSTSVGNPILLPHSISYRLPPHVLLLLPLTSVSFSPFPLTSPPPSCPLLFRRSPSYLLISMTASSMEGDDVVSECLGFVESLVDLVGRPSGHNDGDLSLRGSKDDTCSTHDPDIDVVDGEMEGLFHRCWCRCWCWC